MICAFCGKREGSGDYLAKGAQFTEFRVESNEEGARSLLVCVCGGWGRWGGRGAAWAAHRRKRGNARIKKQQNNKKKVRSPRLFLLVIASFLVLLLLLLLVLLLLLLLLLLFVLEFLRGSLQFSPCALSLSLFFGLGVGCCSLRLLFAFSSPSPTCTRVIYTGALSPRSSVIFLLSKSSLRRVPYDSSKRC